MAHVPDRKAFVEPEEGSFLSRITDACFRPLENPSRKSWQDYTERRMRFIEGARDALRRLGPEFVEFLSTTSDTSLSSLAQELSAHFGHYLQPEGAAHYFLAELENDLRRCLQRTG